MATTEIQAKKSFGQNFLVDQNIIRKIIDGINPQKGEAIVEIGPGQGALTEHLLEAGAYVTVLELDERMLVPLGELDKKYPNQLTIIMGDALKKDLATLMNEPYKLVGNLPYNVGTQIVVSALEVGTKIKQMTFMLQKEVVERIVAQPSTSDWGRLGILCDLKSHATKLFDVPSSAFVPRPKVTSAIVQLTPREEWQFDVEEKSLAHILLLTFTKRRKMLRASLKKTLSIEEIESTGLSSEQRPETLSTEEFCKLANLLKK